jgi:nucleotide-binding universal stress UspA family protein
MFKHILIPTDGSDLSHNALRSGLKLAKQMNAKVSALHVTRPFHVIVTDSDALTDTREQYNRHAATAARRIVREFEQQASEEGVRGEGSYVSSDHPYEAIIKAAQEKACDLILMASHGRNGIQGLLLGSQTQKVLTHSKIPVLVYR